MMTTATETTTLAPRPVMHCELCGHLWDAADYELALLLERAAAAAEGRPADLAGALAHLDRDGRVCEEVL